MKKDVLPPFLENGFYDTERELSFRFNEPIATKFATENLRIVCKRKTYFAERILAKNTGDRKRWDRRPRS